jgi:hypothetical protein
MIEQYKTIHIFGRNRIQLIGEDFNKVMPSSEITSLEPLLESVRVTMGVDELPVYHVIHIFVNHKIALLPKERSRRPSVEDMLNNRNKIAWDDVNEELVQALIDEMVSKSE